MPPLHKMLSLPTELKISSSAELSYCKLKKMTPALPCNTHGYKAVTKRLLCFLIPSQITMWDLQSGKLLRTITDAHPLGSAVLHVMVSRGRFGMWVHCHCSLWSLPL